MKITLQYSDACRCKAFEAGQELPRSEVYDLHPNALTPAARALLTRKNPGLADMTLQLTADVPGLQPKPWFSELVPESPEDWETVITAWSANQERYAAEARKAYDEDRAQRMAEACQELEERLARSDSGFLNGTRAQTHQPKSPYFTYQGLPDYPRYVELLRQYNRRLEALQRKEAAADEEARQRRLQEAEAERAEREVRRLEKLAWVAEHGGEHLRRAVEAGYDCQRLYVSERAAQEYPEYQLDFDEELSYKSRNCPSPEALEESLKLADRGLEARVVWADPEGYGRYGEAVVIENYLGSYRLYRMFPSEEV